MQVVLFGTVEEALAVGGLPPMAANFGAVGLLCKVFVD